MYEYGDFSRNLLFETCVIALPGSRIVSIHPYNMLFTQKKAFGGFIYETEDVFGTITITSALKNPLKPETLDSMVVGILHAGITTGSVGDKVTYVWKKRPVWEDDEDTTPIDEPQAEKISLFSKLKKFVRSLWQ